MTNSAGKVLTSRYRTVRCCLQRTHQRRNTLGIPVVESVSEKSCFEEERRGTLFIMRYSTQHYSRIMSLHHVRSMVFRLVLTVKMHGYTFIDDSVQWFVSPYPVTYVILEAVAFVTPLCLKCSECLLTTCPCVLRKHMGAHISKTIAVLVVRGLRVILMQRSILSTFPQYQLC